jgi:hypothetical protein
MIGKITYRPGAEIDTTKADVKDVQDLIKRGFVQVQLSSDEVQEPETEATNQKVDVSSAVKSGSSFTRESLKGKTLGGLLALCAEHGAPTEFSSKEECLVFLTTNSQ